MFARVKPGSYAEGNGINHVSNHRTIEAMYGLSKSGAKQPNALPRASPISSSLATSLAHNRADATAG
jgi:hypothetical protein